MANIEFDSATLPPESTEPPEIPDLDLAQQKVFILNQAQIAVKYFAILIARGLATKEELNEQSAGLRAVMLTLDRADNGEDIRRSYSIRKPNLDDFAPRARPRKTPEQIKALSAPAPAPRRTSEPRPFNDALPDNLQPIPVPHDLV